MRSSTSVARLFWFTAALLFLAGAAFAQTGSIEGTVVARATGAPVAAAVTVLPSISHVSVATDASGHYVVSGLPPGSYTVVASPGSGGYLWQLYSNINCYLEWCPTAGTPVSVTAGVTTSSIDFALDLGGTISGRVTDAVTSAPLAGVHVVYYASNSQFTYDASTDASGNYSSVLLVPGTYFVKTSYAAGHFDKLYNDIACNACSPSTGTPVTVTGGATTGGIDLALSPAASIGGRITDATTGMPLSGVTVSIYTSTGAAAATVYSDAGGNWLASPLQSGTYFARTFKGAGYLDKLYNNIVCAPACTITSGTPIAATVGSTTGGVDFALTLGGHIAGHVTDAATAAPLAGVTVSLYTSSSAFSASAVTDAAGNYLILNGAATGTYYARTSNGIGYVDKLYNNLPCFPSCAVGSGTPIGVTEGSTTNGIDFALPPGGRISGNVTNTAATPLAGVTVFVYTAAGALATSATTNAAGNYITAAAGLTTGSYFVRTSSSLGYLDQVYNGIVCFPACVLTAGTPVSVTSGNTTAAINFALAVGGRISGNVTNSAATPLAGVTVSVYTAAGALATSATTNAAGNYTTAAALAAGSYFVRTSNSLGYLDQLYNGIVCFPSCVTTAGTPIGVTSGNTTAGINFALTAGGRISGRVTSAATSAPLSGVLVQIATIAGSSLPSFRTDAAGNYTSSGLPAGTYYARTQGAFGYIDTLYHNLACPLGCSAVTGTPIVVTSGGTSAGIDFALDAGGRIAGHVTDAATGQPLSGVGVSIVDPQSEGTAVFEVLGSSTDAAGAYSLTGLAAGWYIVATSNGRSYVNQTYRNVACVGCVPTAVGTPVAVTAGATTSGIDFPLVMGGSIAGRVTNASTGLPVAGVNVSVYMTNGGPSVASVATNSSGVYSAGGLTTGTYYAKTRNTAGLIDEVYNDVACGGCSATAGTPIAVTIGTASSGIDFALAPGGRIAGRVTNATTGAPLSSVGVNIADSTGAIVSSAASDAAGNYTSSAGLPAGTYFASTTNTLGYVNQAYNATLCFPSCSALIGTPVTVAAGVTTSGIDFALAPGGHITGRATDAGSGLPLLGIHVQIVDANNVQIGTVTTDGSGSYTTRFGLATGTYFARATSNAGYVDVLYRDIACPNCKATMGTPISVTTGATAAGIDFALTAGGRIAGTITDAGTGAPLADYSVAIYDSSGRYVSFGTSDYMGRYVTWTGLPTGAYYALSDSWNRYIGLLYDNQPCPASCTVYTGAPIAITAGATTPGIDFRLTRGGSISGRIVDAATSTPLNGRVYVYDASGAWISYGDSDAEGNYVSNGGLAAGSYFVRTWNTLGYVNRLYDALPWTGSNITSGTPVTVALGAETPNINFALSSGGRIAGQVTDAATGAPLRNISVYVYDSAGNQVSAVYSSASGLYITPDGLPAGTYYVRTKNSAGYVNRLYASAVCLGTCNVTAGTPVTVAGSGTTGNINFALDRGAQISGHVTARANGAPLPSVTVSLTDAAGNIVATGTADGAGSYATADGVPSGTYYAVTANVQGYVNQIYQNIACSGSCTPSSGASLPLTAGSTRTGIDFALDPDTDPDGDGIASTIDRGQSDGADQSTTYSSDFNDTVIGGTTSGTITDRGGWNVVVHDISPGGVQAQTTGAGTAPAQFSICSSGGAEGVVLDVLGEWAEMVCSAAGSATVKALVATPTLQLRKPLTGAGTVIDLTTGQSATLGSPAVADPANTAPIVVRFVDDNNVTFGSLKLDPGESIDATVVTGGVVLLNVLVGVVEGTINGQSVTLRAGQTQTFGSPADALDALSHRVEQLLASGGIANRGIANSITSSLTNAKKQLGTDRKAAVNELNALLSKLDAYLKGGQITQRAYDALAPAVRAVVKMLN